MFLFLMSILVCLTINCQSVSGLCYHGTSMSNPGSSCRDIVFINPGCFGFSGFYWIQCNGMNSPVQVYCDMRTHQGGWMRVASENFTAGSLCPCDWDNYTASGIQYCTTPSDMTAASWYVDNICPYSEVRGYVLADQKGLCDGFFNVNVTNATIDDNYVDGISISIGNTSRQHIYTYAIGREQKAGLSEACECHSSDVTIPAFILWDYMCDSGFEADSSSASAIGTRTLFTGRGCAVDSGCCHVAGSPWFYKRMPCTLSETLEVRILSDEDHSDEMVLIREVELYVK